MPVSGRQETGVKSFDGQFSGLVAAVPIKKRRFPLIPTLSPLSGEQGSLTEETESLQKENSSTPQGSTVSNASVADAPIKKRRLPSVQVSSSLGELSSPPEESNASHRENSSSTVVSTLSTNSSVSSDTNKNPVFEEKNTTSDVTNANFVQSNSNYVSPKIEKPDLATHSCALDNADSKEKLIESYKEKSGPPVKKENSELQLAAKESLALNLGSKISKQCVLEKYKQESGASTNLSLGFKEHLSPAMTSLDIGESFKKTEKAEPVSLKLSLSKEEGSSKSFNDDAKTNRANWDLNTTMDAWEEPGSDATTGKTSTSGSGLQTGSALTDNKVLCFTGMEPTVSATLKHTTTENLKAFMISSRLYGQQYKHVNPSNLCLASCLQKYTGEPSRLSVKQKSECATPTLSLSNVSASVVDGNKTSIRTVKSEPSDETLKQDLKEAKASSLGSLGGVMVKQELVERSRIDSINTSSEGSNIKTSSEGSNLKLSDPKVVKPEPGHSNNQERSMMMENVSDQMGVELPHESDNLSSLERPVTSESVPLSAGIACSPVEAICSEQLATGASTVNHLENHASTDEAYIGEKTPQGDCSGDQQVPPDSVARAMVDNAESGPSMKDFARGNGENADDAEGHRLKLMNQHALDLRCSIEDGVSDDEKITLSADMLEDDSYDYDYESDGNHSLTVAMDVEQHGEDDDYEDGEVREPLKHSVAENPVCEVREVERIVSSDCDGGKQIEKDGLSGDCPTSSRVEEYNNRTATRSKIKCGKDGISSESIDMSDNVTDKSVCLQEPLEAEKPTIGLQIRSLDQSERNKVLITTEAKLLSDQGNNSSNEVDGAHCADEVVKDLDMVRKTDSDLPNMEVSVNVDDASKDVSNGGNQGRIINLAQAAGSLSPKSMSIPGRGLSSQAGRDVLPDTFHPERLHGGRDDAYIDGPCKFSRERHQDISPRNSRLSFVRGRGRMNSRIDMSRGEWKFDRDFGGEFYNGPGHFRGPRHKFVSAVHDPDSEYNNVAHGGSFVGNNRFGRKPLNDERPVGRHITMRRRSPGGREMQMGHRIPRTMSPSRCVGDDGSEFVSMRHGEKFLRSYPDEALDPMFSRPQPFERGDGRFTRGTRNFIQRRGPPRIHSKSPIRSRSRSPGPWSPPRRRSPRGSPDGYGGHPDMSHRRYRVDRMRSPDGPVFSGERRVVRRHVSPPYMSRPNDTRDFDSGRGRGHPRSVVSNRGTSGRVLFRNRRFDGVDPQDRPDNDEYFGGPMHSGRQFEINGEGNGDERRRYERRGPVRSFRPPYNGNVGENFDLDAEDGPRPLRFCAADSEFQERSNLRERDFDRRIKNRPANMPPRRTRNIDEPEANYRNSGQEGWSDDGFDDISRVKRKRF